MVRELVFQLVGMVVALAGMFVRVAALAGIFLAVLWLIGHFFPSVASELGLPCGTVYGCVRSLFEGTRSLGVSAP